VAVLVLTAVGCSSVEEEWWSGQGIPDDDSSFFFFLFFLCFFFSPFMSPASLFLLLFCCRWWWLKWGQRRGLVVVRGGRCGREDHPTLFLLLLCSLLSLYPPLVSLLCLAIYRQRERGSPYPASSWCRAGWRGAASVQRPQPLQGMVPILLFVTMTG